MGLSVACSLKGRAGGDAARCVLVGNPREASAAGLMAGAAETIITPTPVGTFLIGPLKESTGVHDDLFARALVISDETTCVAIVTLDFLGLDFSFHDRIVAAIEKQTGMARGNIMVNCSHTHNAPLTIPWREWEKKLDKPWHESMPGKIATMVGEALAKRRAATLRFGREAVEIGFNRRLPTEDGVVMRAESKRHGRALGGRPLRGGRRWPTHRRFVQSCGASGDHPRGQHLDQRRLSRVSRCRRCANDWAPTAVFLFAQGCGANINGFPLQGGIEAARSAGEKLGNAAAKAVRSEGSVIRSDRLRSGVPRTQLAASTTPVRPTVREAPGGRSGKRVETRVARYRQRRTRAEHEVAHPGIRDRRRTLHSRPSSRDVRRVSAIRRQDVAVCAHYGLRLHQRMRGLSGDGQGLRAWRSGRIRDFAAGCSASISRPAGARAPSRNADQRRHHRGSARFACWSLTVVFWLYCASTFVFRPVFPAIIDATVPTFSRGDPT